MNRFENAIMQLGAIPTTREEINTLVLVPMCGISIERFTTDDEVFKFISDYEKEFITHNTLIRLITHNAFIMVDNECIVVSYRKNGEYAKISVEEFKNILSVNKRKVHLYDKLYDLFCTMGNDSIHSIVQRYLFCQNKNLVYRMREINDILCFMKPSEVIQRTDENFDLKEEVFAFEEDWKIKSYGDIYEFMEEKGIYFDELMDYIIDNENDLNNAKIRKILEEVK